MIADRVYVSPASIAYELDVTNEVVRRWIRQREFPTVKIDGHVRVPVEAFQGFLRRKIAVTDPSVV
jgi:excisionase family DNA binding protein